MITSTGFERKEVPPAIILGERLVTCFDLNDKAEAFRHFLEERANLLSKMAQLDRENSHRQEYKQEYEQTMPRLFGDIVGGYLQSIGIDVERISVAYGAVDAPIRVFSPLVAITKDPKQEGYPPLEQIVIEPMIRFYTIDGNLNGSSALIPALCGDVGKENFNVILEAVAYRSIIDGKVVIDGTNVAPMDYIQMVITSMCRVYYAAGEERLADVRELRKLSGSKDIESPNVRALLKDTYREELLKLANL